MSHWVFDFMCETLQSPSWEIPIGAFVDEACVVFDNQEENQMGHMQAHREFKKLVETLLTQHLTEVGITDEEFFEACEVANTEEDENSIAQQLVEQLVACDDFLTFKAIMSKRNKDLTIEALQSMNYNESKEEEYEDECAEAYAMSEHAAQLLEIAELEREEAELEAAIAISLAAEEERLRQRHCDESKESKSDDSESKQTTNRRSLQKTSLDEDMGHFESNKAQVEAMMLNQKTSSMRGTEDFDNVDVARRAKYLKEQREKILAKRNAERSAALKEFEEQKRDSTPLKNVETKKSISNSQSHLTGALARRMKQDLLAGQSSRDSNGSVSYLKYLNHQYLYIYCLESFS